MNANDVMRRDALEHLRVTVDLARRYGIEPADILETVAAALPTVDPTGMEALHSALRREIVNGTSPTRILALVRDMLGSTSATDDPPPVESGPFNLRRDMDGLWALYVGDEWVTNETPAWVDDAPDPRDRREALDRWLAECLRPLFDGSVVTR